MGGDAGALLNRHECQMRAACHVIVEKSKIWGRLILFGCWGVSLIAWGMVGGVWIEDAFGDVKGFGVAEGVAWLRESLLMGSMY